MIASITGASGHVGGNLVRLLSEKGHEVRCLVHDDERAIEGLPAKIIRGSILDKNALNELVNGADLVFHLVALISITRGRKKQVFETNVSGTQNVIDACLKTNAGRLVHMSSVHAISPFPHNGITDETRPLLNEHEGSPYDTSKAKSERCVLDAVKRGLDAVIVNPTGILGPRDYKPSLAGEMLISILKGRLFALVHGGFDWIDVRDVCAGAVSAGLKGKTGERYILSGYFHTVRELALMLSNVSGCRVPGFVAPMWLARLGAPLVSRLAAFAGKRPLYTSASLAALRSHRYVSCEKAKKELGFEARPITETIKDTYDWFLETGFLD